MPATATAPAVSSAEAQCPENRVKTLDFLAWPRVEVRRLESPDRRWENRPRYDGKAVGTVLARYYDPAIGQFQSVDPMVAVSLSPYGYAAGDPVNMSDPYGLLTAQTCVDDTSGSVFNLCMDVVSLDLERQAIAAEYAVAQQQLQTLNAEGCQSSAAYSTLANTASELSEEHTQVATEENALGGFLNDLCNAGACTHSPDLGVLAAAGAMFVTCLFVAPRLGPGGAIDAAGWATVAVSPFVCAAGGAIAHKATEG